MRRVVLGFDVGKTLGYAVVAHNPPSVFPSVLAAGHLTRREHEDVFAFGARARSEVGARVHLASVTHVLIERPPSQVRDDVRHGPQALIGYELGLLSGVLGDDGALGADRDGLVAAGRRLVHAASSKVSSLSR